MYSYVKENGGKIREIIFFSKWRKSLRTSFFHTFFSSDSSLRVKVLIFFPHFFVISGPFENNQT